MSKAVKKDSTVRRVAKQLGLGLLVGGILGWSVGYFHNNIIAIPFDAIVVSDYLAGLSLGIGIILLLALSYQLYRVRQYYHRYHNSPEDDDTEDVYRQLEKSHAYAMTYGGLATVAIITHILFSYRLMIYPNSATLNIPVLGIMLIVVTGVLQLATMKWYKTIRQVKIPLMPTLKELKNNVLQLDEAELEANYKISFEIVMNLSSMLIPLIYMIFFIEAIFLKTVNITGILAVAGIHTYIMLMQFKMIKRFYH